MIPRVFFGWWAALAFSVIVFLSTGIRFTIGPFLKPMVADLGIDRASFSAVVAVALFLYGAVMPFVGRLADRVGARPVLLAGAVVLGVPVAGTGFVTSLWQLYIVYGIGMAIACATLVAASVVTLTTDVTPRCGPIRRVATVAGGR